jgi:hypothetical protein
VRERKEGEEKERGVGRRGVVVGGEKRREGGKERGEGGREREGRGRGGGGKEGGREGGREKEGGREGGGEGRRREREGGRRGEEVRIGSSRVEFFPGLSRWKEELEVDGSRWQEKLEQVEREKTDAVLALRRKIDSMEVSKTNEISRLQGVHR